jgi:hypothetical protein
VFRARPAAAPEYSQVQCYPRRPENPPSGRFPGSGREGKVSENAAAADRSEGNCAKDGTLPGRPAASAGMRSSSRNAHSPWRTRQESKDLACPLLAGDGRKSPISGPPDAARWQHVASHRRYIANPPATRRGAGLCRHRRDGIWASHHFEVQLSVDLGTRGVLTWMHFIRQCHYFITGVVAPS